MFHTNLPHTVLSERLHNYLRRKELTHAEFAKLAGIGTSTVTRCLNNDYIPSTEVYRKIAAVMKVEPDTLAKRDDKEEKKKETPDDFDKFLEDIAEAASVMETYYKRCLFWSRVKWSAISILAFIAVSAWFAMLFVALQS